MAHKFQKLDIDLPRQPLPDQKVWMVAGWLLAALVVLFTLFSYLDYKNNESEAGKPAMEMPRQ